MDDNRAAEAREFDKSLIEEMRCTISHESYMGVAMNLLEKEEGTPTTKTQLRHLVGDVTYLWVVISVDEGTPGTLGFMEDCWDLFPYDLQCFLRDNYEIVENSPNVDKEVYMILEKRK